MSKRFPSEAPGSSLRHSFHCVILEQRAAIEELKACTRELQCTLDDFLSACADLRTAADVVVSEHDLLAAYPPKRAAANANSDVTIAELKCHADQVLEKGKEAIQESLRLRMRSSRVRAALKSSLRRNVNEERARPHGPAPGALSNRERQVLRLIVAGKSSKQIAAEL